MHPANLAGAVSDMRIHRESKEEVPGDGAAINFTAYGGPAHFRNIEIREINAIPPEVLGMAAPSK